MRRCDAELLHVLGHVDAHHGALVVEQRTRRAPCASSVLPTPVGPRNRKLPSGRFGSDRPARLRRTADGDRVHGLVLPDDALRELVLQMAAACPCRPASSSRRARRSTRLTTSAISSAVTSSFRLPPRLLLLAQARLGLVVGALERGNRRRSAARRHACRSPSRVARSSSVRASSIWLLSACTWSMAVLLVLPRGLGGVEPLARVGDLARAGSPDARATRRPPPSCRACSSICIWRELALGGVDVARHGVELHAQAAPRPRRPGRWPCRAGNGR